MLALGVGMLELVATRKISAAASRIEQGTDDATSKRPVGYRGKGL
jgi:hypothetical protein